MEKSLSSVIGRIIKTKELLKLVEKNCCAESKDLYGSSFVYLTKEVHDNQGEPSGERNLQTSCSPLHSEHKTL